jgi:FecR-like protein
MNKHNTEKSSQKEQPAPESMAMEGLLREFGDKGTEPNNELIREIMAEARKTIDTPDSEEKQKTSVIPILKYLLPIAACLAIVGIVFLNNNIKVFDKSSTSGKSPCLMASTPGGIIKRGESSLAISNGMKIDQHDSIKTYKSSIAYLQFNDLSRLKISGNSDIDYKGTKEIRRPDGSRVKKITVSLHDGAIYGNIVKTNNYGTFTVTTPHGKLTTRYGKFILINKPDTFYLEVISGAVQFKAKNNSGAVKLTAGQVCVIGAADQMKIASLREFNSTNLPTQIAASRKKLTLDDNDFERLLIKLYKKKKADICLKRNKAKGKRMFL